jgi:glycosyltransferase involved in cell wall biosynthesis
MRGIHIVPSIEEEASGPTYSVIRMCEALFDKNNDVTLVTLGGDVKKGIKFHKTYQRLNIFYRLGVSPIMRRELDRMVKEEKSQYIHSHGLWMMPNIYAGWVAKKYKIPLIVSPRGALSKKAMKTGFSLIKIIFWNLFQKKSLLSAACFHATSEGEYRDIRRMGFKQPISIISNGVDVQKKTRETKKPYKVLLFLGRIHPIKGVENLLHAWVRVQNKFPGWKLRIAGPGDKKYVDKIAFLSDSLMAKRVDFLGPVYGKDKWEAYKAANVYILPSFSENFGMTIAESLSAGVPVITSKDTPWSGLIEKGAGFWVDSDVTSLELCLLEVLCLTREELYKMGQHGAEWMRKDFSWGSIAVKMSETYEWILINNKSAPVPVFINLS